MLDISVIVDVARGAAVAALVMVLAVGAILLGAAVSLAYWAWADGSVATEGEGSGTSSAAARPSGKLVWVFTVLAVVTLFGSGVLLRLIG